MNEKMPADCTHCHQPVVHAIWNDDKSNVYCCHGCQVVDELLHHQGKVLKPGSLKLRPYLYLDEPAIQEKLLSFKEGDFSRVHIHLPAIHCSSCIYLLESLPEVEDGIVDVQVSFAQKQAQISFKNTLAPLSKVAALLEYIGYPPDFQTKKEKQSATNTLLIKMGVAGFFFGNTMLLALPEYLDSTLAADTQLQQFFRYLMLGFSIPVVFYSAKDYFTSALKALYAGVLGIDLPIALGIAVLFLRSSYEVFQGIGAGYFDSLCGLVFFLLVGKWYQQKTYQNFTFDRDFRSFIPLAANLLLPDGSEKAVSVDALKRGDIILLRNGEVLAADASITSKKALLDYSYITGEALPIEKEYGASAYAGARVCGKAVCMEVSETVERSYLASLWNKPETLRDRSQSKQTPTARIARYFTPVILIIAILSAIAWSSSGIEKSMVVFTAVLIVACPCALALAEPFAAGSMMRWFGLHGLYLKNTEVLHRMHKINQVVFDKTGTLTEQHSMEAKWEGVDLNSSQQAAVYSLVKHSTHPLSKAILQYFHSFPLKPAAIDEFTESAGKGIRGSYQGEVYTIGSAAFVDTNGDGSGSRVYVKQGESILGSFKVVQKKRAHLQQLVHRLKGRYSLALLSGDNNADASYFSGLFGADTPLHFNQSPHEKLRYVKNLQHNGKVVLMLGDGLNDAGALQQSDVGISLCEKNVHFFPASDALLLSDAFEKLDAFLRLSTQNERIIHQAFAISLFYNLGGLSFAIAGVLSPLVCAILMPLSSITVVIFTTLVSRYRAQKYLGRLPS
jgi:Cu+-exporting ATPase